MKKKVCDKCDREFESNRGLSMHKKNCVGTNTEIVNKAIDKPQVELVDDYYESSPRRAIKLKGLLSRTFDNDERNKIAGIIKELEG